LRGIYWVIGIGLHGWGSEVWRWRCLLVTGAVFLGETEKKYLSRSKRRLKKWKLQY
jgi:hypothetical protein